MTQSTTNNLVEKLLGRENYDFWKVTARSYLTIKGYWTCVMKENTSTDSKEVILYEKALAELFLMIDKSVFSHVGGKKRRKRRGMRWKVLFRIMEGIVDVQF